MTSILGINAYHGDSSACMVTDGRLTAAAEEERFRRIKHWAGFPTKAIQYCLEESGKDLGDIDHIAINRNPKANLVQKAFFLLKKKPSFNLVQDRLKNAFRVTSLKEKLAHEFGMKASDLKARVHNVEHHIAHLASAHMVSPFDNAAVVSVDGFGDFVGSMWGIGRAGNQYRISGYRRPGNSRGSGGKHCRLYR